MTGLRVAFDHQIFDLQRYGGVSRYIVELAGRLAHDASVQVSIEAPLHINEYLRNLAPTVKRTATYVGGVPKVRRFAHTVNALLMAPLLRRRRPDIVHRTYYAAGQPAVRGARSVITVHDLVHERIGAAMAHDTPARDKRAAIAEADHAICISENTRRDLVELFGVDPEKTSVVHHGFSLMAGAGSQAVALPDREFILYVGLRGNYKNFRSLLDAYAESARLRERFDIVCFGGGGFSAEEAQAIAASGARAGAVRQLTGSDAALQTCYRRASLFVYTSLYEGFGIPLLEAMSFQCPVVCCPVASMPEVVGDAAMFFQPGDTGSLIAAIEAVANDLHCRADLVRRGTERTALFSWQRCADQTLAAYAKLLS